MTSRERLLITLNHKTPDKIPWSGLINNYFIKSQKNNYYNMSSSEFLKEMGADLFDWVGFEPKNKNILIKTFVDNKLCETGYGDGISVFYNYIADTIYHGDSYKRVVEKKFLTPLGELNTKFTYTPLSHSVFISEFPIKKVEDYKAFTYMMESLEYKDLSKEYQDNENNLGEDGVTVSALHCTPAYELIQCFMGLERFHYFFQDYKKRTLKLMEIMFDKFCECYRLHTKLNVPVFLIPEDASTTLYSPDFFNTYLKPVLKEYVKIIKESGKLSVIHACGHLKNLIKSLSEIDIDCIESVSPQPIGDISVQDLKKALPNFCIMGGIPANVFLYELDDFKQYIKKLIIENKKGGNYVLSSGDSVPSDARIENLKAITYLVEKYGKY